MGSWSRTVVLTLAVLLMSVALSESARSRKRKHKLPKKSPEGNSSSLCEPRYLELSPSHTRCLVDNPNATQVQLSQRDKDSIIKLHNDYRRDVLPVACDMMKLQWDENLAITASKWVMQCIGDHDQMNDRKEPDWIGVKIGQNLGMGHRSWNSMLGRMYGEKTRLNYIYGEGYIAGAGHFYQLVTARTTRVGCGQATCPHTPFRFFRACNYAPALNAVRPPYKNDTSCADCPDHCDPSGKLCDCKGVLCYNGGTLDPRTCKCVCQEGKTGDHCEKVDCSKPDPFSSCRSGFYSSKDCGRRGIVIKDPKMCPHLCGLCDKPCGGLECKNGGTLNWDTCQCRCRGLLSGPTCETCPTMDKEYCTRFMPKSECSGPGAIKVSDCPIYCGVCNTTCAPCQNHGDLNTQDCSCKCKGGFTGDHCQICPAEDPFYCIIWTERSCTETPNTFAIVQTECPHKCGLCPRNAP